MTLLIRLLVVLLALCALTLTFTLALVAPPPLAHAAVAWKLRVRAAAVAPPAYPDGVVARGLQSVFDYRTTAGVNQALTKTPGADCASLPGGCGVVSGANIYLTASGSQTLTNWDFSGYTVWIDGEGSWTITQAKFDTNTAAARIFAVGNNSGSPTVVCNRCTFDFGDTTNTHEGALYNKGTLTLRFSYLDNAAMAFISQPSGGALTIEDSYLRRIGQRPRNGAHLEAIHAWNGSLTILRTFIDLRDGHAPIAPDPGPLLDNGGMTGIIYPEGAGAAITWSVTDSILAGTPEHGGHWAIQFGDAPFASAGTMNGNVIAPGSSGHIYRGANGSLTGSNNVSYATGAAISLP